MSKFSIYGIIIIALPWLANAESIHANKICFNMHIELLAVLGGRITTNQPYSTNISLSDNNTCIIIRAGRELSSIPTEWVKNNMKIKSISWASGNMTSNTLFSGNVPSGLNFAINLDILFDNTYECDDMFLGQGSNGMGINNWWIFSNNNFQNHTITCTNIKVMLPTKIKVSNSLTDDFSLTVLKN